jgi:tRNA dimethylallyltransferase
MPKKIWLIIGPTAAGKTDYSIRLANNLCCPILSADSRQIYKELNIGVAKPTQSQLDEVKHYFINHVSIFDDYNVGKYVNEARQLINELFQTYNDIIVCGGTGLYINSLINGIDVLPSKNEALRNELNLFIETNGIELLIEKHASLLSPKLIESKNPQRIIRAIEIGLQEKTVSKPMVSIEYPFEINIDFIDLPREELYQRINARVDQMLEDGLEEEALLLYKHKDINALKTVGYSEWWPYFEKEISKEMAIEKIKQHTRNYAKRQVTWFKNQSIIQQ